MKSGLFFNCIQEVLSRGYGLMTGDDPYPLRSLLRNEYEKLRPKKILDVGCGSGCYPLPGYDYLGIDPNPHYIAYCRRKRPGRFEQMSAEHLDFADKTFDIVLCLSVAYHLPNDSLRRVCTEIKRVLRDDGVLIFAEPVRPVVRWKLAASFLEWLDEGHWFRYEQDYIAMLGNEF
jgi:SAM-dependent methyltransferase